MSVSKPEIIVGIGASAGGLEALQELLDNMPLNSQAAYVIAQHMSPSHKSMMVELLRKHTQLPVQDANDAEIIRPEIIYVTPPNKNITVSDGRIKLAIPADHTILPKPSIDYLFTSLAEQYGSKAVGIILSGTGSDGSMGMKAIKAEGGITIVQDPKTAKYNSMPLAAINDQHVDIILPPQDIGEELVGIYDFILGKTDLPPRQTPQTHLMILLSVLKQKHGVDFSEYKKTTINRRIQRRMVALHINDTKDYVKKVEDDPEELSNLFNDMLIGVTSFFRDAEEFEALRALLQPMLEESIQSEKAFRVWIAACSTGEEAYSLAILLYEMGVGNLKEVSIFATDIDAEAIAIARSGIYPETLVENIPENLLNKYFNRKDDKFQIKKFLREMIIFSIHDVTNDPPFARLDLVLCRNLLIYFNLDLQERVLRTFSFALKNSGLLFLGSAESVSQLDGAFSQINSNHRIYRKIFMPDVRGELPALGRKKALDLPETLATPKQQSTEKLLLGHLINTVAQSFLPLSVLINESMSVLYLREENPYLKMPARTTVFNILKMVPQALELDLRTALHDAQKTGQNQYGRYRKIKLMENIERFVRIVVLPVNDSYQRHSLFVVSFEEQDEASFPFLPMDLANDDNDAARAELLQLELNETRMHLQTVVEELETSNEELQAANEELQSTNEELQSTNEELETTNEELHSTNEEIQVAYNELKVTSEENAELRTLAESTRDSLEKEKNLLKGVSDSSLNCIFGLQAMRNDKFEIYDFKCIHLNDMAANTFLLKPARHLQQAFSEILPDLMIPKSFSSLVDVCNTRKNQISEIQLKLKDGLHYFSQVTVPYLDGVVVSLYDISERVNAQVQLDFYQNRFRLAAESSQIGIWEVNLTDDSLFLDETMYELLGLSNDQSLTLSTFKALFVDEHKLQSMLNEVLAKGESADIQLELQNSAEAQFIRMRAKLFNQSEGTRILGTCIDTTREITAQTNLLKSKDLAEELNERKSIFIANTSHELRTPLHAIQSFTHLAIKKTREPEVLNMLEKVEQSSKRLRGIIDDLLQISRLRSGKVSMQFKKHDLRRIIKSAQETLEVLFEEKSQQVTINLPSSFMAEIDSRFIEQVIVNLLSNANKFAPHGSEIVIYGENHEDEKLLISVEDQGAGVDPDDLERIFEAFERSEYAERKALTGTGLGLAICKNIIESHHGEIWAESPLPDKNFGMAVKLLIPVRQKSSK